MANQASEAAFEDEIVVQNGDEENLEAAEGVQSDVAAFGHRYPGFNGSRAFETPIPIRGLFDGDIRATGV